LEEEDTLESTQRESAAKGADWRGSCRGRLIEFHQSRGNHEFRKGELCGVASLTNSA
jgi:hypothetical protein